MGIKVKLITHTPDAEKIVATAAKLCYSPSTIDELSEKQTPEAIESFIKRLISMGHESPVEHVSFTFAVEGVSRSLTHQLVRHRIASFSQQSQRYVKLDQFEYIVPPAIAEIPMARDRFINSMERSALEYDALCFLLVNDSIEKYLVANGLTYDGEPLLYQVWFKENYPKEFAQFEKKAIEDARYVFPNACETKIMFTMNARTLFNFFGHRCCSRAQWEIRELAFIMLQECKKVAPLLFSKCGPSCAYGACKEGPMCCGKQAEMKLKYSEV